MKTVVICGSRRFKPEMRSFSQKLKDKGVVVYEPYLHEGGNEWDRLSQEYKKFCGIRTYPRSFLQNSDG